MGAWDVWHVLIRIYERKRKKNKERERERKREREREREDALYP